MIPRSFYMRVLLILLVFFISTPLFICKVEANKILVPMDNTQTDHLRAYGLVYWALSIDTEGEWLLNYRGGSFLLEDYDVIKKRANELGVLIEEISEPQVARIYQIIEENNMNRIHLSKAPKIAVYAPSFAEPWDDAVRLVLEYAKIPYTRVWDEEVLAGILPEFDWVHLHHEDFTGQFGKFYASYRNTSWYQKQVADAIKLARKLGYSSVQEEKCAVAKMIQAYVADGGFLFAMCAAVDTIDIALAAEGIDIVPPEIDGTPITPDAQEKLNFSKTFAFQNFHLIFDPYVYEFSDIDVDIVKEGMYYNQGNFVLFDFSAKIDPVPCMLNQNHTRIIKDFLGQTTGFYKNVIKPDVTILAEYPDKPVAKYIHGEFGKGTFTFLGGHDPEDYKHLVGDPPTDLSLHKNSPGYRLILNNVLFPAAKKKRRKT